MLSSYFQIFRKDVKYIYHKSKILHTKVNVSTALDPDNKESVKTTGKQSTEKRFILFLCATNKKNNFVFSHSEIISLLLLWFEECYRKDFLEYI